MTVFKTQLNILSISDKLAQKVLFTNHRNQHFKQTKGKMKTKLTLLVAKRFLVLILASEQFTAPKRKQNAMLIKLTLDNINQ